jgi:SOS response regulatory protein OraA/RecX
MRRRPSLRTSDPAVTDSRIESDGDPAGEGAGRVGGRRSGGSARARQGGRSSFGDSGRARGSRRGDSSSTADPGGPAPVVDEMADPEAEARGICLRALTGAPKTRQQLADVLERKEVPPEVAEAVLDRFTEVGLIDDAAFAAAWVSSRQSGRGLARRALASELRAKGVDGEVVAAAVAEIDPQDEWDSARRLVQRRAPSMRRLDRVTAERRLVGMLARKGYGGGLAGIVVREALDELGADAELPAGAGDPDDDLLPTALEREPEEAEAAEVVPGRSGRSSGNGFGKSSGFGTNNGFGKRSGSGAGSGFGAGGLGGRKTKRSAAEGKPNGGGLGGAGGISGQRAANMTDEVGEGHWEPISRRPRP